MSFRHFTRTLAAVTAALLLGMIPMPVSAAAVPVLDRPALELVVGMTDTLTVTPADGAVWSSSDPSVVSVKDGTVTAKSVGEAEITVTTPGGQAVCRVFVVKEKKKPFGENIILSNFWPPIGPEFITEEQYQWMQEAHLNYIMGAGENVGAKDDQLRMLAWCHDMGMTMMIGDDRTGRDMMYMSDAQLDALMNEYKNLPGAVGWHLCDEPPHPADFQDIYLRMKQRDPDANIYFNFYPYGTGEGNIMVDDWLRYCAAVGYPMDYYMFDVYSIMKTGTDYARQLSYLDYAWKIARRNDVPLSTFVLTTEHLVYDQPDEGDIRWQVNTSLAFGSQYICYFTWFCPRNADNAYKHAIIDRNGQKTDLYEPVKEVNAETLTIGSTLVHLTAYDVRVEGSRYTGLPLTSEFPVQSDSRGEYIVSLMRNDETGRNYLMFVNNDSDHDRTLSVRPDKVITSLRLIDNGSGQDYTFSDGVLTMNAEAGEAFLFELPAGLDLVPARAEPAPGDNLVKYGYVMADKSVGGWDYAIPYLQDGERFSGTKVAGWKCEGLREGETADVTVDFGAGAYKGIRRSFDRVDIYPLGRGVYFGTDMPTSLEIQVSDDFSSWKTVASVTDYAQDSYDPLSVTFDRVTARYVRVHITGTENGTAGFCELEVYNTADGCCPAPVQFDTSTPVNTNLAPNAHVTATSSQEAYGWSVGGLTDGYFSYTDMNCSNGYCSGNKGETDVVLDFGLEQMLDEVRIYPALDPFGSPYAAWYPKDFTVDVSGDGESWISIASYEDYVHKGTRNLKISLDEPVTARFVRLHIIEARYDDVCLGEMEIYLRHAPEPVTEPETETAAEPETAPEESTAAETETQAADPGTGAAPDTASAVTEPDSEAGTNANPVGCSSAASCALAALLVCAAAAAVLKKRNKGIL